MSPEDQPRRPRPLHVDSDALLERLEDLRRADGRMHDGDVSTAEFHRLSDDVEVLGREVFRLAEGQGEIDHTADTTEPIEPIESTGQSID